MSMEADVLSILFRREYWEKYGSQFSRTFFESDTFQTIFEILEDYWSSAPTAVTELEPDIFTRMVQARIVNVEEQNLLVRTCARLSEISPESIEPLVRDGLLSWKVREIVHNTLEALEARRFDPNVAASQFESLARALDQDNSEKILSPTEDIMNLMSLEDDRVVFPTGILGIDAELVGGLWAKELGIIIAPSFGGKTYAVVHLACNALRAGYPVLHVTTEISRKRAIVRYCQNLLARSRGLVLANPEQAQRDLQDLNLPAWQVLDYSATGVRTSKIRYEVKKFVENHGGPALVIVDHLDLETIKPNNNQLQERFALTAAAEELRQIAVEMNCGLWTPLQANRGAFGRGGAHVRMEHAAESLGPVRKADVVITLNQNEDEKETEHMRWYIAKGRERIITNPMAVVRTRREIQRFEDD